MNRCMICKIAEIDPELLVCADCEPFMPDLCGCEAGCTMFRIPGQVLCHKCFWGCQKVTPVVF